MKPWFILVMTLSLSACSMTSIKLFIVNSVASLEGINIEQSLSYGPLSEQQLNIYSSEEQSSKRPKKPVVIFFYGGCWGACITVKKDDYLFVAEALTSNGYLVVIPDYRLFPEVLFADIIGDAGLVVEWVSREIVAYGGDDQQIFLMGHSAGAHLAAMLTFDERYLKAEARKKLRGFIGLAGAYDFLPFTKEYQKTLFGPAKNYYDSQPINFVEGSEPASLLLYGEKDQTVKRRNIDNLSKKIQGLGGDAQSEIYPEIDHVGILAALSKLKRESAPVVSDLIQFLNEKSTLE